MKENQSFNKLKINPEPSQMGQPKNLSASSQVRPPIVVVMGHVDHGKTSLLDFIRRTNVAAKEAGAITQSIGAYEITHPSTGSGQASSTGTSAMSSSVLSSGSKDSVPNGSGQVRKITFIDTPGHEAFSKMRMRGAKVADLGILVIAADEAVKSQTQEAIKILKESKTPFVVAINKIDKPNADIEKTKQELMQAEVLLEGFGGDISWQAISSKTGQGINELLDLILLSAELEKLTYNPESLASGVIIESKMDSRRGLTAIAIVKDGILKIGDEIATLSATGKIKILENFLGEKTESLEPSSPALILGFETLPQIGEEFLSGKIELIEMEMAKIRKTVIVSQSVQSPTIKASDINLCLKADVSGSLEALSGIIKTFPNVKIISESVGDITDGDVKSALSTKATIIGFRVKVNKAAENLAKAQGIKIITSEIIYELLKNLETELETLKEPVISGKLEILGVFGKKSGKRQIVGGRVIIGILKNNSWVKIQRQEQIIGQAKIINLQLKKQDAKEANEGDECGLLIESETMVNARDYLVISQ